MHTLPAQTQSTILEKIKNGFLQATLAVQVSLSLHQSLVGPTTEEEGDGGKLLGNDFGFLFRSKVL